MNVRRLTAPRTGEDIGRTVLETASPFRKALLTGIALAAAPIIGLNVLLGANLVTSAQHSVDGVATEVMSVVEGSLDDVATALISLGLKRPTGCDDTEIRLLQAAAARSGSGVEIAIVDANDAATCSSERNPRVVRRTSPEHGTSNDDVSVSTAAYGETGARQLVRVLWRKEPGEIGYRALIPSDRIIPLILKSPLTASFVMQLSTVDGTVIVRKFLDPHVAEITSSDLPSVAAMASSERYPMRIDIEVPGSALLEANVSLFIYANLGGLGFGLLVVTISVLLSRRGGGPVRQIADGIRKGEFIPYYQPVIDIVTGQLAGCEVLTRWRRPDGAVLPPGRFIALAEASGEIFPMTIAIMRTARDELADIYSRMPTLELGFNLFAGHFDDTDIVGDVRRIFEGSPIQMDQLMFEVTERQPLHDITRARTVISQLQALGARVALDDVGTGHGGLSYLLKLGVDVMKLDKMFVDAIGTEGYSVAIVDSLVQLARDMNLELIAEGVETAEQLQYLREKGVRMAQGYVFAPPLPAASFIRLALAMNPGLPEASRASPQNYAGPIRMVNAA